MKYTYYYKITWRDGSTILLFADDLESTKYGYWFYKNEHIILNLTRSQFRTIEKRLNY